MTLYQSPYWIFSYALNKYSVEKVHYSVVLSWSLTVHVCIKRDRSPEWLYMRALTDCLWKPLMTISEVFDLVCSIVAICSCNLKTRKEYIVACQESNRTCSLYHEVDFIVILAWEYSLVLWVSHVTHERVMSHMNESWCTHTGAHLNMVKRSNAYVMSVILCVCVVTHSCATWVECDCDDSNARLHLLWVWFCVCVLFVMSVILRVCVMTHSYATWLECKCYDMGNAGMHMLWVWSCVCVCHDSFICDMTRMQKLRHGKCSNAVVMSHIDLYRI